MKKISTYLLSTVLLLVGLFAFAGNTHAQWSINNDPGDCKTLTAVDPSIHYNNCAPTNNHYVNVAPGQSEDFLINFYYHNSGSSTAPNVSFYLSGPYNTSNPTTSRNFSGNIEVNGTQVDSDSIGVTFSNPVQIQLVDMWDFYNVDGTSGGQWTEQSIPPYVWPYLFDNSQRLSIGDLSPGWVNQGVIKVQFRATAVGGGGGYNPSVNLNICQGSSDCPGSSAFINDGSDFNLSWLTNDVNLNSCTITDNSSAFSIGSISINSGYEYYPNVSYNNTNNGTVVFTLNCTGLDGQTYTDQVTLNVNHNNGGGGNPTSPNFNVSIEACEQNASSTCTSGILDIYDGDDIEVNWDVNGNIPDYCRFDSQPEIDNFWDNDSQNMNNSLMSGTDNFNNMDSNDFDSSDELEFSITCYDQYGNSDSDSVRIELLDDNDNGGADFYIITLNPQDISGSSARFRGEVRDEQNVDTWFEWGTSFSTVANGNGTVYSVSGLYDDNDEFDRVRTGLTQGTTYYYRACGEKSGDVDCGSVKSFSTPGISVVPPAINTNPSTPFAALTEYPQVVTLPAVNITDSTATLLGAYDAKGCNEFTTYFRLGKSPSQMFVETERKFVGNTKGPVNGLAQNAYGRFYYQLVGTGCGYNVTGGIREFFTSELPGGGSTTQITTTVVTEQDDVEIVRIDGNQCIDLDISNGLDKDAVFRGEQVTYKVEWEHRCIEDFENVVLRIDLSPGMDFIATERGQYTGRDEHAIVLQFDEFLAGERDEFDFTVVINQRADFNVSAEAVMALGYKETETENDTSETVIAFDIDNVFDNQNLFGASIFQSGFFSTPWGWLVSLLMLLGLGMFARYLYMAGRSQMAPAYAYPQPMYMPYAQQRPVQYIPVAAQPQPVAPIMAQPAIPAVVAPKVADKTVSTTTTTTTTKSNAPTDLPTENGKKDDNSNDYQLYRPKPLN